MGVVVKGWLTVLAEGVGLGVVGTGLTRVGTAGGEYWGDGLVVVGEEEQPTVKARATAIIMMYFKKSFISVCILRLVVLPYMSNHFTHKLKLFVFEFVALSVITYRTSKDTVV